MFWIISCLIFIFLRLPSLFEPYWYGDEGIYLALGQGIRHGLTLYSQIHDNKPPSLYYLAAFSQTVLGFRLLLFLWMIPTVYFFYRLGLKYLKPKVAKISTLIFIILTSIPLIEGNIANAEVFMLLPTILAFLYQKMFFSGLMLGLAFTFKIPVAFEFAFLFGWFFLFGKTNKFKNLIIFSLAFLLPSLLYLIYFYFKGALPQYLFAALLQNFGYISSYSTGSHQSSVTSGGIIGRLVILMISVLFLFYLSIRNKINKNYFFLSGWFLFALFGVLLPGRPYPHYLIQILPSLLILIFYFKKQIIITSAIILLLILSLLKYKFYFYHPLTYYTNFLSYVFRIKNESAYRLYFGGNMDNIYELKSEIQSKSEISDSIFIWSDDPYLYPLSSRLPATKYLVAYHILDFNGYSPTIDELILKSPKLIIYNSSMTNRPFPALDNFISSYYFLDNQIGPYYIFQRR